MFLRNLLRLFLTLLALISPTWSTATVAGGGLPHPSIPPIPDYTLAILTPIGLFPKPEAHGWYRREINTTSSNWGELFVPIESTATEGGHKLRRNLRFDRGH